MVCHLDAPQARLASRAPRGTAARASSAAASTTSSAALTSSSVTVAVPLFAAGLLADSVRLGAALAVSLIATIIKFGDRSQMGAVLLATSLVADLQLIIAAFVWGWAANVSETGMTSEILASIVSLSGGALLANLVSVTLLLAETISIRR